MKQQSFRYIEYSNRRRKRNAYERRQLIDTSLLISSFMVYQCTVAY